MKKIYLVLLFSAYISAFSQVGIGTANPNASAALDITSTEKGLLLPRVTSVQRTAIASPATGLIVFDTDLKLLHFYNGVRWVPLVPGDAAQAAQQTFESDDPQAVDNLGFSVSISGDYAIAGAPNDGSEAEQKGSAYIYFRNGGEWVQQAKLIASDGIAFDRFGFSVDIAGEYAIVGAPYNDEGFADRGAAYIFRRSGTIWGQVAKIIPGSLGSQHFGYSVSIDGEFAVIGAPDYNSLGQTLLEQVGKVEVYRRVGAAWNMLNFFITLTENARLGVSVSLQGNFIIAGAPSEEVNGEVAAGAAYTYEFNGTNFVQEQRLTAAQPGANDLFGYDVDIDNGYAVVGAPREGSFGNIHVFKRGFILFDFVWVSQTVFNNMITTGLSELGSSVSISGDNIIVGDPSFDNGFNANQGACLLYKRAATESWSFNKAITQSPGYASDRMGVSVSLDNQQGIIGIPADGSFSVQKARVYFAKAQ